MDEGHEANCLVASSRFRCNHHCERRKRGARQFVVLECAKRGRIGRGGLGAGTTTPLVVPCLHVPVFVILALYFDVRLLAIFFVPQINIGFSVFSLMLLVVNLWKTRSDAYLRLVLPRHSSPLDPAPLSHPSLLTYFLFSPP